MHQFCYRSPRTKSPNPLLGFALKLVKVSSYTIKIALLQVLNLYLNPICSVARFLLAPLYTNIRCYCYFPWW